MKISIAIPTWDYRGKGSEFINDLFRTIQIQSHKDFEVCISDHSKEDEVFKEVKQFENKFKIVYSKNDKNIGNGPANTNAALDLCTGDIIKVMFQDDFFYDTEALEKINYCFENNEQKWLVNGCNHTQDDGYNFFNEMYPRWNPQILEGVNTISSPSVVTMRKECIETVKFDEKIFRTMDCEFYFHMNSKFNLPYFLDDVLITNRIHPGSLTEEHTGRKDYEDFLRKEIKYSHNKHGLEY